MSFLPYRLHYQYIIKFISVSVLALRHHRACFSLSLSFKNAISIMTDTHRILTVILFVFQISYFPSSFLMSRFTVLVGEWQPSCNHCGLCCLPFCWTGWITPQILPVASWVLSFSRASIWSSLLAHFLQRHPAGAAPWRIQHWDHRLLSVFFHLQ